ncbi:murein hydrolase activator EnvC family protein [Niastella sp. OAS944]|uniref:murein hydrolase activator EnvC family protein n=1 Tax=Niastella sp. OAS944 TaxID=2664089 RepID=UPI0034948C4A|nr:septal ring factor EnvC (AmiA/AmiB activator) [Chitinophagaceae bacterium OAS944]
MLKWMATGFLTLVITVALHAQQPAGEDLKQQQMELQREIDELNNTLKDSKQQSRAGQRQLEMVKKKLRLREKAIDNINRQVKMLEGNIGKSKSNIDSLKDRLDTMKVQYARNIVYSYKLRNNYEYLSFIFSANSFTDAFRRAQYFRAYHQYCEDQVIAIKNTQKLLTGKLTGLEIARREKDAVIEKQEKQKEELEEEKKEKNAIVKTLKSREKDILKELNAKKTAYKKVMSAVTNAIGDVYVKEYKSNESPAAKKEVKKLELTPEGKRISGSFEDNKGHLPWPVEKASIKMHFGRNVQGPVVTNNPGLTLETEPGATVKAIFEGEVVRIFDIEGAWSVIVRHGKYFSVYSNLQSVNVSRNQKIGADQLVGIAAKNTDGNGEIDFILMQEIKNLDPEKWLKKK